MKVGFDIAEMSVRPSVRTPPPKRVLTVRFSKFFFCWKGMTSDTYLLFFLSVRPSLHTDGQTDKIVGLCRNCSSRPILKILFLLERYDTRFLYKIHFVRLSVRTDVQTDRLIGLLQISF